MDNNWITSLDALAANGVIDYDAGADILGVPPRYVGNPDFETIPQLLPDGTTLQTSPNCDTFGNGKPAQSKSWVKWTIGGAVALTLGGLIFALSKGKIKIPQNIGTSIKTHWNNLTTHIKNLFSSNGSNNSGIGKKIIDAIKKPFTWIASKFKKSPAPNTPLNNPPVNP